MKLTRIVAVMPVFLLITGILATHSLAMDDVEYREWEEAVSKEATLLKERLPAAQGGDSEAIKEIISLATGEYIRTAEGGEWLNEVYLDLLVAHPEEFLRLLSASRETPMKIVVLELLNPVTDTYTNHELKGAIEKAKKNGVNAPFMKELLDFYSKD